MIPVTYRAVLAAFLKEVWSSIRNLLPILAWRSRAGSMLAVARPSAPATASQPSEAAPAQDALAVAVKHLELLGYEVERQPDGWSHARHPYRYSFFLLAVPHGIRLECAVTIGAAIGNSRPAWLEFLNSANERGLITQFWMFEDKMGEHAVRMSALVSGSYRRRAFALAIDMWQNDLDIVRRKPEFPNRREDREDDNVAVSVH